MLCMYEIGILRSKYTLFPLGHSVSVDTRCPVCGFPGNQTCYSYKLGHIKWVDSVRSLSVVTFRHSRILIICSIVNHFMGVPSKSLVSGLAHSAAPGFSFARLLDEATIVFQVHCPASRLVTNCEYSTNVHRVAARVHNTF